MTARRAALVLVMTLPPFTAGAQGLEKAPTPIDVTVSAPSATAAPQGVQSLVVLPGTKVTIAGHSVPMGPATQVKVTVKPPSGPAVTLTAGLAADNRWSTVFTATTAPGHYAVSAQSPEGTNTATASFAVGTTIAVTHATEAVVNAVTAGAPEVGTSIKSGAESAANRGDFPNREQVLKNLQAIEANAAALPARLADLTAAGQKLGAIAEQYPGGASELEPIATAMSETAAKVQEQTARVTTARAAVENTNGVCDRIDAVNEMLSAVSLWYDLEGLLFQKIVSVASDKYLGDKIYNAAVPPAKRNNTDKFALTENLKGVAAMLNGGALGGKAAAAEGLVDFVKKPQNLIADTTQLLTGMAFDKYCEKFTGPVSGSFAVDATINGGLKFWGYTAELNGTMTLMYEKSLAKGGAPIPMTGEIEGNAFFKMYEQLMNFNAFNKQFVLKNFLVPPIGMGAAAQGAVGPLGKVARMATPGYFRVPVKGRLDPNGQLTVTVGDHALNDFTEAVKGRVVYIMLPPASPIPYTMIATIPVQKAQFILSRGLRTTATMPVATRASGTSMVKVADQTFDRVEHVSNGEVTVTWKINVKACNPDCQ